MTRVLCFFAAIAIAATAQAQGVSVVVRQQGAAQELPPPAQQPQQAEVIVTPQPQQAQQPPTPWVLERHWEAVPIARWGFFGRRLVPRVLYRPVYSYRPAQVAGPYYYYR